MNKIKAELLPVAWAIFWLARNFFSRRKPYAVEYLLPDGWYSGTIYARSLEEAVGIASPRKYNVTGRIYLEIKDCWLARKIIQTIA